MTSTPARVLENPFHVLGLTPSASRMEIEREAQKLLGMLELGLAAAASYATPLGPQPRTPELVRAAVATLRDPARRLAAELWARGGDAIATIEPPPEPSGGPDAAPWPDARARLGWGRR